MHTFHAAPDGSEPKASLIADRAGNLFGATYDGGGAAGAGTVYEMHPPLSPGARWTETILHSFSFRNLLGGLGPWGGLAGDKRGNLYDTAWLGGVCGICGLVFEISPPKIGGRAGSSA